MDNNYNILLGKIKKLSDQYKNLPHLSNIRKKFQDKKHLEATSKLWEYYENNYLAPQLAITGVSDNDIRERVKLLNNYYNFFITNNLDKIFTFQGKMRSTILEEFIFLLFHPYFKTLINPNDKREKILLDGGAKAYTNLYVSAKDIKEFIHTPRVKINEKDQDYAIYRKIKIKVDEAQPITIKTPIIAVECKTHVDKTMLQGIITTAEDLKSGNPFTWFGVVTESYEVDFSVDLKRTRIDQIYVLRKQKKREPEKPIDSDVVIKLFKEVKHHIEGSWSDTKNKMETEGILI